MCATRKQIPQGNSRAHLYTELLPQPQLPYRWGTLSRHTTARLGVSPGSPEVMKYVCAYPLSLPQLPQRLWAQGGRKNEEGHGYGYFIKDMHEM